MSWEIGILGAGLALAAATDTFARRIPNAINVALALVGLVVSWRDSGLAGLLSSLGAAVLLAGILMPAWRFRALGGGDLKLAVACGTWVQLQNLPSFALASCLVGGALAAACWALSAPSARREVAANLRLATMRAMPQVTIGQERGRVSVPYGVGFAAATLWIIASR